MTAQPAAEQPLVDWLAGRSLPTAQVTLPTDPDAYAAAEVELVEAARALVDEQQHGALDVAAERHRLAAARAALAAIPTRVIDLVAVPPQEWEPLVEAHPPTEAEEARGWEWHLATFRPALVARSMVGSDGQPALTEQQLDAALAAGRLTIGELQRIYDEALTLNKRTPRAATGKG